MHAAPPNSTLAGLLLAAAFAAALGVPVARAQQPVPAGRSVEAGAPASADTSVAALVAALRDSGPAVRSFRRTSLPDVGTSLCAGQVAAGARGTQAPAEGPGTRNLEVVPYAGDTTPGVNLSVQFALNSDRLTAADQALLDRLALALQSPELAADRFAVAGHTDASGQAGLNLELSCARALAVRRHLAGRGVAAERLSAYGFGSGRLLVAEDPRAGGNRRVEIRKAPQ
jgi:outer membrane protein OmpA-like peptidoglycan-associated protein